MYIRISPSSPALHAIVDRSVEFRGRIQRFFFLNISAIGITASSLHTRGAGGSRVAISEAADFIFNGQTGYTLWAVCALLDRADAPPLCRLGERQGAI